MLMLPGVVEVHVDVEAAVVMVVGEGMGRRVGGSDGPVGRDKSDTDDKQYECPQQS